MQEAFVSKAKQAFYVQLLADRAAGKSWKVMAKEHTMNPANLRRLVKNLQARAERERSSAG